MTPRIPIEKSISLTWSAIAQGSRMSNHVLQHIPEPAEGSNFSKLNEVYPHEKSSDWHRGYLDSAVQHLLFWSDALSPLDFDQERELIVTLRPTYTLGRSALEAAAQAVWVSSGGTVQECARRHLCLVRGDFAELKKSKSDLEFKSEVDRRDNLLLERVAGTFSAKDIKPQRILTILREAAPAAKLDADEVESVWRAASGAAHGKSWPSTHLQHVIPIHEYEPGQFRTVQIPDTASMTRVVEIAEIMTG